MLCRSVIKLYIHFCLWYEKCALREPGSKNMFLYRMSLKAGNNLSKCVAISAAIAKSDDTQYPKLVLGFSNGSLCKISRFSGSRILSVSLEIGLNWKLGEWTSGEDGG